MLRFSSTEITELSGNIKILDVLEYYQLQPVQEATGRWKLRCTLGCFDKTPSLKVWEDTNSWYAYCCGEGGDSFQFIRLMEDDFTRALEILASLGHYSGSIDDLLRKVQQFEQNPQVEQEQKRIFALHYILCVAHRDFLLRFKTDGRHTQLTEWVDQQFERFDDFFDQETTTFEEAEVYYQQQLTELRSQG